MSSLFEFIIVMMLMVAKGMRSDLVQAGESNPKVMSILEEGEVARDPVKVNPDSCCNIFPERLDVGLVPARMPQQPLVAQTPGALLLSQHVDKSIHVQPEQKISFDQIENGKVSPGATCANAEHHAGAKYPLGDVDLPVISAAIENPAN